ncbi:MAG: hypothetical protein GC168_12590 [Candidatus Hydrogenedens sp.]|nr:hypothetical protein [Candidatus Hydrogenedens sp.]
MKRKGVIRAYLNMLYLAGLFGLFAAAYSSITAFDGEVYIPQGSATHTVVAEAAGGAALGGMRMALPPDLLEIPTAAQRRLDTEGSYVTTRLPFALGLESVEVLREYPPTFLLEAGRGDSAQSVEAVEGAVLRAGQAEARVEAVRPWMGLLRRPGGRPMAAIGLEQTGARSVLLVEDGRWLPLDSGTALRFRWCKSADQAEAAAKAPDEDLEQASWTVAEGGTPVRMNSFTPGAGAEMDDGRTWAVERVERREGQTPRLVLKVTGAGQDETVVVEANEPHPKYAVRFDDPGAFEFVIGLYAGEDGAAWVRIPGIAPARYAEGQVVEAAGQPLFTLRQVVRSALPVTEPDREVLEAVLSSGGKRLYIREGEAADLDGARVLFRRVPVAPDVRYHLVARWRDKQTEQQLELAPDETGRVGAWYFTAAAKHPDAERAAVLSAHFNPFTPDRVGLALVVAAAIAVLTWVRFRPMPVSDTDED